MLFRRSQIVILITLLSGCLQPIEIVTDQKGENIVISGQLSNLTDQSIVTVGVTANQERLPFPISDAVVNLFEGDDLVGSYVEDESYPGKYVLNGYAGLPGKTYHVRIVLPDNTMYESTPEKMPGDPGSLSTYFKIEEDEVLTIEGSLVKQEVVKIFANSTLPEPTDRYVRWTVEEVFIILETAPPNAPVTPPPCFVRQFVNTQSIMLLDRIDLASHEYPEQFVAKRDIDYTFMLRHYFVTYQSTLTKEAYDYWREVEILLEQAGSIYATPPAKIYGNVSSEGKPEKAFGYFQVVNQTLDRVLLQKDDFLPHRLNFIDCVGSGPFTFPPPERCSDCLSVRNSSLTRPEWF